jgi:hypothetical protein
MSGGSARSFTPNCPWETSVILDDAEMCCVVEKFRTYGQQNAADPDLVFGGAQPGPLEGS